MTLSGCRCAKQRFGPYFFLQVLGAENDAIFSVEEVRATARAYRVEATIFPDMAHNMIAEPGWRDVADTIMRWAESVSGAGV